MNRFLLILFFFITTAFSADTITKVITLNYISSSVAYQALQPLLAPSDSISTAENKLIVSVSPETLTKIRTVLHALDVAPATFIISVHQDQADWLNTGDNSDIVYSTRSQSNNGDDQSVQVSSGASAFVATGNNVPMISSVGAGSWNLGVSFQREQVNQGFLIEPQLQGSKVRLKIRRMNDQVSMINNQQINTQSVDTTTIISVNKWVKIGSAGQANTATQSSSDVVYTAGGTQQDEQTVYIKVSLVK